MEIAAVFALRWPDLHRNLREFRLKDGKIRGAVEIDGGEELNDVEELDDAFPKCVPTRYLCGLAGFQVVL